MKREKRLTKKERKATQSLSPTARPSTAARTQPQQQHEHRHIHCIACGKHLDADMFGEANGAEFYRCQHGSDFPHCVGCKDKAKQLVDEHDRTNKPVQSAAAWH
jgi:hypothetical protein